MPVYPIVSICSEGIVQQLDESDKTTRAEFLRTWRSDLARLKEDNSCLRSELERRERGLLRSRGCTCSRDVRTVCMAAR